MGPVTLFFLGEKATRKISQLLRRDAACFTFSHISGSNPNHGFIYCPLLLYSSQQFSRVVTACDFGDVSSSAFTQP